MTQTAVCMSVGLFHRAVAVFVVVAATFVTDQLPLPRHHSLSERPHNTHTQLYWSC